MAKQAKLMASATPSLLASILFGTIVWACQATSRSTLPEEWENVRYAIPAAQIAFAAHCALSRRPGYCSAIICSVASFLIWANASTTSTARLIESQYLSLLVADLVGFGMLATCSAVLTVVFRPGSAKPQIGLKDLFGLTTWVAFLVAMYIATSPNSEFLGMALFLAPHALATGLAIFLVFNTRHWYLTVPGAILASAVLGLGLDRLGGGVIYWGTVAELALYCTMLMASLAILRVADHFAQAASVAASKTDAPPLL